jgi:hypothetical protein
MKEIWPLSETMNHNMNFSAAGTISFQLTGGTNRYSGVDNDPETRNPRITYHKRLFFQWHFLGEIYFQYRADIKYII